MSRALDDIASAVSTEVAMLTAQDGIEVDQVADLMGYTNPSMVYAIANPEKMQMPTCARFLLASQAMCELGNTRLARLALGDRHAITVMQPARIDGSLADEIVEMSRAMVGLERMVIARRWEDATAMLELISGIASRCQSEVAVARGAGRGNVTVGDPDDDAGVVPVITTMKGPRVL